MDTKNRPFAAIRFYVLTIAVLNLAWEVLQLPLYTLWQTGSRQEIAIAIFHCTAGDIAIAVLALVFAILLAGAENWPARSQLTVGLMTLLIGVGYTIYSEHFNLLRGAWTYTEWMPIIPGTQIGLFPILQWLLIPGFCLWITARRLG